MSTETYCAVVESGLVVNMLVIEENSPLFASNPNWIYVGTNPQKIAIGWSYDGTTFTPPPLPPVDDPTQG